MCTELGRSERPVGVTCVTGTVGGRMHGSLALMEANMDRVQQEVPWWARRVGLGFGAVLMLAAAAATLGAVLTLVGGG